MEEGREGEIERERESEGERVRGGMGVKDGQKQRETKRGRGNVIKWSVIMLRRRRVRKQMKRGEGESG